MNVSAYEGLFIELGFTAVERGKKLRHINDPPTLYFNWKRGGEVYFTGQRSDRDVYFEELWREIPAQQKKDSTPELITVLPVDGKERQAFNDFLNRSAIRSLEAVAARGLPESPGIPVGITAADYRHTEVFDFASCVNLIEHEYSRLGHTLGWRFLTGRKAVLESEVDIWFITLNPGGDRESPDHPRASCETGNAYLTETWGTNVPGGAPLQRQVQMLFSQLANKLGDKRSLNEFVDSEVMSAYFIPFRSPTIAALPRRKESLAFAIRLWSAILELWMPRCILTIDTETFGALKTMLAERAYVRVTEAREFPTGWGHIQAESIQLTGLREDGAVTIARLPHLSRFQLFGNSVRAPQLDAFVEYLTRQIQPKSKPSSRKG